MRAVILLPVSIDPEEVYYGMLAKACASSIPLHPVSAWCRVLDK